MVAPRKTWSENGRKTWISVYTSDGNDDDDDDDDDDDGDGVYKKSKKLRAINILHYVSLHTWTAAQKIVNVYHDGGC